MIESTVINKLLSDATLCTLVSTFNGAPAIFSGRAPETATLPYIVVDISRSQIDFNPIQPFSFNVDYFDYNRSESYSRAASERIEYSLHDEKLTSSRYGDIRIWLFNGSPMPTEDPRDIHYNLQFMVRATRVKWINETKV